jgi:hypothetical protein
MADSCHAKETQLEMLARSRITARTGLITSNVILRYVVRGNYPPLPESTAPESLLSVRNHYIPMLLQGCEQVVHEMACEVPNDAVPRELAWRYTVRP